MNGIWYYAIAFLIIWIVAIIFRKPLSSLGFEINPPTIMWKTKRLHGLIDKLANISKRFWKGYMTIGIVASFIAMIITAYLLIQSLSTITTTPSVSLVIPGVEVPGSPIVVPFGYGLIALATVLIVHEFSHGILARVEKVSVKSVGLLLFAILPGAFVEPDDDEIEKISRIGKMRIYAAGSVANMTLALIAILLVFAISTYAIPGNFHEDGVEITKVLNNVPASNILESGMIINSIDGKQITDTNSYLNVFKDLKPNQTIAIGTNKGIYHLTTGANPNNKSIGYLGIYSSRHYVVNQDVSNIFGKDLPWIWFELGSLLQWVFILNLSIGMFNLLPIKLLDGGHLFRELFSYKLSDKLTNTLLNSISMVFIAIIVFSLVYSFVGGIT
jgi:membrane-associated protease RseP (regulator of RpoE activity)